MKKECPQLSKLGYEVTGVAGRVEALEIFTQYPQQFDLVITDLDMPHMTGDQLVTEILKIRPGVPIILCTGFSERFDQRRTRMLGARKLIRKPLAINILAESVREIMDSAKA